MDTGLLIALGSGVGILVLAVLLSLGTRRRKRDAHDLNGSDADNRATATWAGIREANHTDHDSNN